MIIFYSDTTLLQEQMLLFHQLQREHFHDIANLGRHYRIAFFSPKHNDRVFRTFYE